MKEEKGQGFKGRTGALEVIGVQHVRDSPNSCAYVYWGMAEVDPPNL